MPLKRLSTIILAGLITFMTHADTNSKGFIPGEITKYKVTWAGIPLAWSKTTTDTITENGRKLIRIRMVSKNYKAYTFIYKINDVTEIIIDPETALPLRLDLTINEGSREKSHLTTFHHDKKTAIFHDRITKDIREVPIQSDTKELFSFFYSIRNKDLETLALKKHHLFVDGKIHALTIKLQQENEIKLPSYGKVPSIEIEPSFEFDGLFLSQGKISFWVSKQNRRMVTCIDAKIPVGTIRVKLQDVSGPGDDFWTNKK